MYQMVQGAYSVTLVGALVPLALGIYWSRATTQGALLAIVFGMGVWGLCLYLNWNEALHARYEILTVIPAQLCGLLASLVGMLIGSLCPQWIGDLTAEVAASEPVA